MTQKWFSKFIVYLLLLFEFYYFCFRLTLKCKKPKHISEQGWLPKYMYLMSMKIKDETPHIVALHISSMVLKSILPTYTIP